VEGSCEHDNEPRRSLGRRTKIQDEHSVTGTGGGYDYNFSSRFPMHEAIFLRGLNVLFNRMVSHYSSDFHVPNLNPIACYVNFEFRRVTMMQPDLT
jgi:hypothetical protein